MLPAQYWNNWSYQLKLSDVSLPPQVRPHLGTNRWQTIISVHNHVNKTITCCTKVGWKEKKNYQDWRNPAACKTSQVTQVCITQHKAAQHWEWERILTDTTCKKKKQKRNVSETKNYTETLMSQLANLAYFCLNFLRSSLAIRLNLTTFFFWLYLPLSDLTY